MSKAPTHCPECGRKLPPYMYVFPRESYVCYSCLESGNLKQIVGSTVANAYYNGDETAVYLSFTDGRTLKICGDYSASLTLFFGAGSEN